MVAMMVGRELEVREPRRLQPGELRLEVRGLRYGVFFLSAPDTSRPEPTLEWYAERMGALPPITNPRFYQRNARGSIFTSASARELLGWEATSDFNALRATLATGD